MKYYSFILFLVLSFLAVSCSDNIVDVGTGIQPSSDGITVGVDTFQLATENVSIDYMTVKPDSFLLGSFYDAKYGTTQADILAQVEGPIGFKYPPGAVVDSVVFVMKCYSWFGDKYAPLDVNIYEMNKNTFNYTSNYASNLDPNTYVDFSNPDAFLGHSVMTARYSSSTRKDSIFKTVKLSQKFAERFLNDAKYTSEKDFSNFFGGLYIKVKFGVGVLLNVRNIGLESSYHYPAIRNGRDTILTGILQFPANMTVRQVNRISHPDKATVLAALQQKDTVNYISSPANIQTNIVLPLAKMKARMVANQGMLGKKLTINNTILKIELTELDSSDYAPPLVNSLLLIKESELDDLAKKSNLPTGSNAVLGTYAYTTTSQFYTFDIASLIATEIKNAADKNEVLPEKLKLRLIPVDLTYNSSNLITAIKQQNSVSAITIRSGKNKTSPMKMKIIYSGF